MSERWFCEITGEAWITRLADGSLTWKRADAEIHVCAEIADKADDYPLVFERYEIRDWCPLMSAYHARRRDA